MTEGPETEIALMDTRGMLWASSKARMEAVLGRRPGVLAVDANPVAQTATIRFDPDTTTVSELVGWIRDCGSTAAGSRCRITSAIRWRSPAATARNCRTQTPLRYTSA